MKYPRIVFLFTITLLGCSPTNITFVQQTSLREESHVGLRLPEATPPRCDIPFTPPDIKDAPQLPTNLKSSFDKNPDEAFIKLGDKLIDYRNYLHAYHKRVIEAYRQYELQCKK